MLPLSVVIVACNEAERIGRALASVQWADDIVVVDSGSTDGTQAICLEYGARVIHHAWDGFIGQKNFAVTQARNEWVLNLDADEEISSPLRTSIEQTLATEPPVRGYQIARCAFYLGRWIRHSGWYPDYRVRLWDRRHGRFGGYEPHADVKLDSRPGRLRGDILHYPYRDISDNLRRIDSYTTAMAGAFLAQGRHAHLWPLLVHPPWTFLRKYILQGGFLDGFPGLVIAGLSACSVFAKYAKMIEGSRSHHDRTR